MLAREAARRGLDHDEEVVRTKKQVMIQQLMKVEFDGRFTLGSITEAECRQRYDANAAEYRDRPFKEVATVIRHRIHRDRRAKALEGLVATLTQRARVQLFLHRLGAEKIDTNPAAAE